MKVTIDKRITNVINRDKKVILTTTRGSIPFVADRIDGDYVYDISGNRFIDFATFITTYPIGGESIKLVRKAVKMQVDKLAHAAFTDFYSELPVTFAEKLLTMFPSGFGRVFYSNSGTEANEAAIKYARLFTKRQYIMSFYNSFHGRSLGSLSLTASKSVQRAHFGPFSSAIHAPYPYLYRSPFGNNDPDACAQDCIEYIRNYPLDKEVSPKEVAAIFIEPVAGEGGYIVPPKKFMKELRALCDEHGILLVADEVQSGYMRTGKFLAMDNFGIKADIYTMAKAIGGGLPMGVTVVRSDIGEPPEGAHSNTFGGNLVSIAAASALLDYVKRNMKSLEHQTKTKGAHIMRRLNEMKDKYGIIGDVRGLGMMIGVEFVKDKYTKEYARKESEEVIKESFYNGLVLLPCGESTIRIIPPITMHIDNINKGLDTLEDAIRKVDVKR